MHKILLIIKREYLTRVRKRTFIIGTILFPVLYLLLIFGTGYIAEKTRQDLRVGIVDHSGYFNDDLVAKINKDDTSNRLTLIKIPDATFEDSYDSLGYSGYVVIPANASWKTGLDSLQFNTRNTYGIGATVPLEVKLNKLWNEVNPRAPPPPPGARACR